MILRRHRSLAVLAAALLAGCAEDEAAPGPSAPAIECTPGRVAAPAESGPHVLWSRDAASLDNPFPDGRPLAREPWPPFVPEEVLGPGTVELFRAQRAQLDTDGVAPMTPILVRFSEAVDPATVTPDAVFFADAAGARLPAPEVVVVERDEGDPSTAFAFVRPTAPHPSGGTALLVVTDAVRTATGAPLVRGAEAVADPACYPMEWAKAAAAAGLAEERIVLALPLPVQDPTVELASLPDRLPVPDAPFAFGPKDLSDPARPRGLFLADDPDFEAVLGRRLDRMHAAAEAGGAPLEPDHSHVGAVALGTFRSRDLRGAPEWIDGRYQDPGVLDPALVADPEAAPLVELDVVVTLPAGPPPPGGFPAVICQHGMGGRNRVDDAEDSFALALAETMAKAGLACVGLDIVSHGARGPFLPYEDPGGAQQTGFFDLKDLRITRDHFRQTAIDQMQLARALAAGKLDVDGDGAADAGGDVGYFGVSLGGITGATLVSTDTTVRHGVLTVPGGGLSNILASVDIETRIGLLIAMATRGDIRFGTPAYKRSFWFIRSVAMQALAPADPIHYGATWPGGEKPVLLQLGVNDLTVPLETGLELAAAMGVPEVTGPRSDDGGVSGYAIYDTAAYVPGFDDANGHAIFWNLPAARAQATAFLASKGTDLPHDPP